MITFKNYLLEALKQKTVTLEEAAKFIAKNCSDIWNNPTKIYRGMDDRNPPFIIVDPANSNTERKAAFTINFANVFLSNITTWSEFPKRNKSIVATTNRNFAGNYGNVYCVFPVNGTKIAICSNEDFWYSFSKTLNEIDINSIDDFNLFIVEFIDVIKSIKTGKVSNSISYNVDGNSVAQRTEKYEYVVQDLEEVDQILSTSSNNVITITIENNLSRASLGKKFVRLIKKHGSCYKAIEALLDSKKNNFNLATCSTINPKLKNNEVWFSDKAVLVLEDEIEELTKLVNKLI